MLLSSPDPATLVAGALAGAVIAAATLLPLGARLARARVPREAYDALVKERERLALGRRLIFEEGSDAILITADGVVLDVNAAFSRLFGVPRERIVGTNVFETMTPRVAGEVAPHLGHDARFEIMLQRPDGTLFPCGIESRELSVDGRKVRVATIRDLSEWKRATQAVEETHRDFREMIERMPIGVALHHQGVTRYANRAMLTMLGRAQMDEVAGRAVAEFVHPDDRETVAERIRDLVEGRQPTAAEIRFFHKDGHVVVTETFPVRLVEFEGEQCHLVVVQDVTERRDLEHRLRFADRMVSVGTLAAGVAHEVNNPLAWVAGNLELALEDIGRVAPELPRDRADSLAARVRDALDGAERVRRIVRDLRSLTRDDDDSGAPVDVREPLEAAIRMCWNELRHRARLVRRYRDDIPRVQANEARLAQVFLNLLVNGVQALPEGDVDGNAIEVATSVDARGRVVIEVSDTGPGVPHAIRGRVFDPFFTTKAVGEGTGLGLPICHGIVTGFGGEIEVDDSPTGGACFRVRLPAVREPVATARTSLDTEPQVPRSRVLVVDDEPAILELVQVALPAHDVVGVGSGRRALELVEQQPFDLVLCDLMMPDLTGMDVYDTLRRAKPTLASRMVFLTGGAFTPKAREFLASIDNVRLEKPFSLARLRTTVARELSQAAQRAAG